MAAAHAGTMYLPEYIKGKRIIIKTEVAGRYLLDNSARGGGVPRVRYRLSTRVDDRAEISVDYGSVVEGTLKDGWLEVQVGERVRAVTPACAQSPLPTVDLHQEVGAIAGDCTADTPASIIAAVEAVGLQWYSSYVPSLRRLVQVFAGMPAELRPLLSDSLHRLVGARLLTALTAGEAAESICDSTRCPSSLFFGGVELATLLIEVCATLEGEARHRVSVSVPQLLRGAAGGLQSKDLEHLVWLCEHAAFDNGPVQSGTVLSTCLYGLVTLDSASRAAALSLLRTLAICVLPELGFTIHGDVQRGLSSRQSGMQGLTMDEIRSVISLADADQQDEVFQRELQELMRNGATRSDVASVLSVLATTSGHDRRAESLRCATWLHSASPAWLQWTKVHVLLQSVQEQEARSRVIVCISRLLQCDEVTVMVQGKDEDFAAGVSPRFERWIRWIVSVAADPSWLERVSELYDRLLSVDPSGKSILVPRLASAHGSRCTWAAPPELGGCYCEHVVSSVVPRLWEICVPSVELLDSVANHVRWRRGGILLSAVREIESLRSASPGIGLQAPDVVASLISCHYLLESEVCRRRLRRSPPDCIAAALAAISKSGARAKTAATTTAFQLVLASLSAGALAPGKEARDAVAVLVSFLARVPLVALERRNGLLLRVLEACLERWHCASLGGQRLTGALEAACCRVSAVIAVCHSPPRILNSSCDSLSFVMLAHY